MHRIRMILASTVLVSVVNLTTSVISGQEPGIGDPNGFGGGNARIPVPQYRSNPGFKWIANEAVQNDLKLTDKQKDQIKTAKAALDEKEQALLKHPGNGMRFRSSAGNRPNPSNEPAPGNSEPLPDSKDWFKRDQALKREIDVTYSKILTKAQLNRLNKIHMRQVGLFLIWDDPSIAQKLNLSEVQRWQIDMIEKELQSERQVISAQSLSRLEILNGDERKLNPLQAKEQRDKLRSAMLQQIHGLKAKRVVALSKVLTKGQRATYDKMLGEPFDISKLDPPRATVPVMGKSSR